MDQIRNKSIEKMNKDIKTNDDKHEKGRVFKSNQNYVFDQIIYGLAIDEKIKKYIESGKLGVNEYIHFDGDEGIDPETRIEIPEDMEKAKKYDKESDTFVEINWELGLSFQGKSGYKFRKYLENYIDNKYPDEPFVSVQLWKATNFTGYTLKFRKS